MPHQGVDVNGKNSQCPQELFKIPFFIIIIITQATQIYYSYFLKFMYSKDKNNSPQQSYNSEKNQY